MWPYAKGTFTSRFEQLPIKIRLSLGYSLCMSLSFGLLGLLVIHIVERQVLSTLDAALFTAAHSVRDSRSRLIPKPSLQEPHGEKKLKDWDNDEFIKPYAQLVEINPKTKKFSRADLVKLPVTDYALTRARKGLETFETFRWDDSRDQFRQITLPLMTGPKFSGSLIQIGTSLEASFNAVESVRKVLWIVLPLGLAFSMVVGYILSARALAPVVKLTDLAQRLSIQHLDLRLRPPAARDELQKLALTFNGMLDRIEDSMLRLKRFPAYVSHELRTPLTVIRGEVELALKRERSAEDYKNSLKALHRESLSMSQIVEDILLLAKAQGKALEISRQSLQMQGFFDGLRTQLEPLLKAKNQSLVCETLAELSLEFSPHYFELVLKNLILNASRHSPQGATIYLRAYTTSQGKFVEVEDHGEGIAKEALESLFDPFFRVDSARNRSSGGVGLGLSLVKALVQLHGALIEVESELGKGSKFRIELDPKEGLKENLTLGSKVLKAAARSPKNS